MNPLLMRRRAVMNADRALPYDARVEYLGSTNSRTQWIDTGIIPQSDDVITIEYKDLNGTSSSYNRFFGVSSGPASRNLYLQTRNSKTFSCIGNTSSVDTLIDPIDTNWHVIQIDLANRKATVDGGSPITVGTFSSTTYPLFLFGLNSSGSCINRPYIRVKRFSISDKLNLLPVRVGTVGYMYDTVSGHLFGNDGSGSFTVGQDI